MSYAYTYVECSLCLFKNHISYHRNGIMEECVRIVAEHPRTAETILPEISFLNYQYILLESEVAAAT